MPRKIPFTRSPPPPYTQIETLSPIIRRITARNPSSFTYHGTGTYIVGHATDVTIIDPGPLLEEHVEAIKRSLKGEKVRYILITHTHSDHSPAAQILKQYWDGVKTYGFGPHGSGRASTSPPSPEEFEDEVDYSFTPDIILSHNEVLTTPQYTITTLHTPGHTSNHLCFALKEEKVLFTGDAVMGWSTSVIIPPDGNMMDYMSTLDLLLQRAKRGEDVVYWPTHGTCINNVEEYVQCYKEHRLERKQQIYNCFQKQLLKTNKHHEKNGKMKILEMVPIIYQDLDAKLYNAAALSMLATIIWMVEIGQVRTCDDDEECLPTLDSTFILCETEEKE